jgi:hypothetical protein
MSERSQAVTFDERRGMSVADLYYVMNMSCQSQDSDLTRSEPPVGSLVCILLGIQQETHESSSYHLPQTPCALQFVPLLVPSSLQRSVIDHARNFLIYHATWRIGFASTHAPPLTTQV